MLDNDVLFSFGVSFLAGGVFASLLGYRYVEIGRYWGGNPKNSEEIEQMERGLNINSRTNRIGKNQEIAVLKTYKDPKYPTRVGKAYFMIAIICISISISLFMIFHMN